MQPAVHPDFAHWSDNLAGKSPPIHDGQPHCGFYKRRLAKDGPWVGAAIWNKGGAMVCRVGNEMRDPAEQWLWLARHPMPKDDVMHYLKTGAWPSAAAPAESTTAPSPPTLQRGTSEAEPAPSADQDQPAPASPPLSYSPEAAPAAIGHNSGASDDPYAKLAHDVEAELDVARAFVKRMGGERGAITDPKDAQIAGNRLAELRKASSAADAWKAQVVTPLYAAYKAKLDQYTALDKPLAKAKEIINRLIVEHDDRVEAAAAEARRKAAETERQAALAASAPEKAGAGTLPLGGEPPADPPPPARYGGDTGRAVGIATRAEVVIDDLAKALKALKDEPEIAEAVLAAAKRIHRQTGKLVAGAKLEQRKRVA